MQPGDRIRIKHMDKYTSQCGVILKEHIHRGKPIGRGPVMWFDFTVQLDSGVEFSVYEKEIEYETR